MEKNGEIIELKSSLEDYKELLDEIYRLLIREKSDKYKEMIKKIVKLLKGM